jgi:aryl-alcohol dehydrogenase-like predicted oxidoreductase
VSMSLSQNPEMRGGGEQGSRAKGSERPTTKQSGIFRIGSKAPVFVVGCEQLGGTDWGEVQLSSLLEAYEAAHAAGVTWWDTAPVYGLGKSEERLGSWLKSKDSYKISTKTGLSWLPPSVGETRAMVSRNSSPEALLESVRQSCAHLKKRPLDLVFIHWPDKNSNKDVVAKAMERAVSEGWIRSWGVSNHSLEDVIWYADRVPLGGIQLSASLIDWRSSQEHRVFAKSRNIPVYGYGPLAQGLLAKRVVATPETNSNDRRYRLRHFQKDFLQKMSSAYEVLESLANQYDRSIAQVSVEACFFLPGLTHLICGLKSKNQFLELWEPFVCPKLSPSDAKLLLESMPQLESGL